MPRVIGLGFNLKIFSGIIGFILVFVVNLLAVHKEPSHAVFHQYAMQWIQPL